MPDLYGLDYSVDGMLLGWARDSQADFADECAHAAGGDIANSERTRTADSHGISLFSNNASVLEPITIENMAEIDDELRGGFKGDGGPWSLWSPWPTPDLTPLGYELAGHPPLMLRPAGGEPPPVPSSIEIREVTDAAGVLDAERVMIEGFPLDGLTAADAGTAMFTPAITDSRRVRIWVGYVDGAAVATAAVHEHDEVNLVEAVAVIAAHRRNGYGEALTWMATRSRPDVPAILHSSDPGRPVYERMGYQPVSRFTFWIGQRA